MSDHDTNSPLPLSLTEGDDIDSLDENAEEYVSYTMNTYKNEENEHTVPNVISYEANNSMILPKASDTEDLTLDLPIPSIPPPIKTNEKLEWIAVIDLSNSEDQSQFFSDKVNWKGLDWFVLLQFRDNPKQSGICATYVAYDIPADEESSLHLSVRFQFTLLDNKLDVLAQSPETVYSFSLYKKEDRGFSKAFDSPQAIQSVRARATGTKCNVMLIKVTLFEVFACEPTSPYNPKTSLGLVGLENLGATCYLNSLLQMLYHINAFRNAVYQLPCNDENSSSSYTLALQNVFRQLQSSDKEVNTKDLLTAFGWTNQDAFAQQDVQEMMRVLLDKLEEKMKGTVVEGAIRNLFCGKVRSFIKCVNVDYSSIRDEEFYDIQLDVKGCRDLHESFKKYIAKEMLDGDNQYEAGDFGKQNAEKGIIFTKLPPVLTLQLKRFDFDLQRMRFIKIHDYYEFSTRINLDQYISEDTPAESKKIPNNYVLHSVLVHTGDVGGGHYYLFIRPSVGYSYEPQNLSMTEVLNNWNVQEVSSDNVEKNSLNEQILSYRKKSDRDGKWFKFNDECVHEVREFEAVNNCFGRLPANQLRFGGLSASISSAYMLVYIREHEAKEIMAPVSIPSELIQRLEREHQQRLIEYRKIARQQLYKYVPYAIEEDVKCFREYSRFEDFVCHERMANLKYINQSSRLSFLYRIAKIHDLPLSCLRLRSLKPFSKRLQNTLRPMEEYSFDELREPIDPDDMFYVHVVSRQNAVVDDEFEHVVRDEGSWLEVLKIELLKLPEFESIENIENESDIVEGCGLFSNNEMIIRLIPNILSRRQLKESLKQVESDLLSVWFDHLKSAKIGRGGHSILGFFKIFDPYNMLPFLNPIDDLRRQQVDNTEDPNAFMMQYSNLPLKYLDSWEISARDTIEKTIDNAVQLIIEQARSVHPDSDYSRYVEYIENTIGNYMFLSLSPSGGCFEVTDSEDGTEGSALVFDAIQNHRDSLLGSSGVFILDFIPEQPPKTQKSLLPFDNIKTVQNWLNYMATKKTFEIESLTAFDEEIITRASLQTNSKKTADKTKESKNKLKRKLFNASDEENCSDEIDSVSDASESDSVDHSILEGKRLVVEFPTSMLLRDIVLHIHQKLKCGPLVNSNNLVFYIISEKERNTDLSTVNYVKPMLGFENKTLQMFLSERKMPLHTQATGRQESSSKYTMYYQVLPYSVTNGDSDLRQRMKFLEVVIIDDRLRKWRRKYLSRNSTSRDDSTPRKRPRQHSMQSKSESTIIATTESSSQSHNKKDLSVIIPPVNASNFSDNDDSEENLDDIVWPVDPTAIIVNQEFIVDYRVMSRFRIDSTMDSVAKSLRATIGIPENINEYGKVSVFDDKCKSPTNTESTEEDISNLLRPLDASTENGLLSSDEAGQSSNSSIIKSRVRKYDVVSENIDVAEPDVQYPIAIVWIRDFVIQDIYSPSVSVANLYPSWIEASQPLCNTTTNLIAAQHIPLSDIVFMRGEHPTVRSMIVSVFSFTLLGGGCSPWPFCRPEPTAYPGPIVTYVREDDDYDTVCRRIAVIIGESFEEATKYRLAVVNKRIPTFIPRSASVDSRSSPSVFNNFKLESTEGVPLDQQTTPHVPTYAPGDIWSLLKDKYPNFATSNYENAKTPKAMYTLGRRNENVPLPMIGIQRSSVNNESNRYRVSSGIKITG